MRTYSSLRSQPNTVADPVPIPTLETWGFLALSALLGLAAVQRLQRR